MPPSRKRKNKRRRRRGRRGKRGRLLVLVVGLALAVTAGSAGWLTCGFQGCPDPGLLGAYQPGGAPVVLDRHGEELAHLHPLEARVVSLQQLPEHVPAAFLAVEDRRFHRHRGVDWWRVAGAATRNVRAGRVRQGASTLTMQLARTLFPERVPGSQRTLHRKLLEIRVAWEIEGRYSKDEILELYLNHVYMGGGAYGVEAAARHYFDRTAEELTLEQAALLAGLLRAPSHYDPRRHPERARQRRDLALTLMQEQGRADPGDVELAREQGLTATPEPPGREAAARAPYFVEVVRSVLEEEFGESLYRSQVRIHTTLDGRLQEAAEAELTGQLDRVEAGTYGWFEGPAFDPSTTGGAQGSSHLEGAVVLMDPATGEILSLVGGRSFASSRYNRAIRARRQMGSAFKPFVFAAALEAGHVTSQPLADRPLTVSAAGSSDWSPRNYDGEFRGLVAMRQALVESLNVPTVRLSMATGLDRVSRMATAAGFSEPVPSVPASALGTASATPLELAGAYAAFAARGQRPVAPRFVTRIEDADGVVIHETEVSEMTSVMDPRTAHVITDMLADVVDRGTGTAVRSVGYRGPAAGKTGTTQEAHDVWFVGYNSEVVGVVWMGFDHPRPILAGATGGGLAAPVWGRIMAQAYEGRDAAPAWTRPAGVVERTVDPETGKVVGDGCPSPREGAVRELFLDEYVPVTECPPREGFRERVTGFFRGLFGGSDSEDEAESGSSREEGSGEGAEWESSEPVEPGSSLERLLGAPRVPLAGAS